MTEPGFIKCTKCDGCGQIANDEDGTPWHVWLELPLRSSGAILAGIVRPMVCTTCEGKGKVPI